MRTKALLLAAAFAAAGVATSVAQVYSVNAVGYVNVSLVPGFNLISNPLDAGTGNNTVAKLFANIQGGPPAQLKVFTFNETTGLFNTAASHVGGGTFLPPAEANREILPGVGCFAFNPTAGNLTLTFVGQVMQGNLSNPIPVGFSLKANQVPQAGKPDSFGLPGAAGDKIFRFNKATGVYFPANNFLPGLGWNPATSSVEVGEGFFFFRAAANGPTTWSRTFNVNNPA